MVSAATLPILEPLCKATEQVLKPIELFQNDRLVIDVSDDGRKFTTEAKAIYLANGRELQDNEEQHFYNGIEYRGERYHSASSNAARRWQQRVPERKETGWGSWAFAATDFTALVIHHVWPDEKLIFKTEEAELLYKFLLHRFMSQTRSAVISAKFKINKEVPAMPADYIDHPDLPLSDYQKVGFMTTLYQEASALFMQQGTGKTPIGVARTNYEGKRKREGKIPGVKAGMYRVLVICPKQVRMNWENEFARFSVHPGKTAVLRGGLIRRNKALLDGIRRESDCVWGACIVSTDSVESTWESIGKVPWDLVILDESHYIKNPKSKRFGCLKAFASGVARQRMILTGTPIANTIFDLWSQFEFLGQGLSGFNTFANFRGFHGKFASVKTKGLTPTQKLVGIKGLPLLQERLTRLAFSITKKEANLGLPDKLYDIFEVDMTPTQRDIYNKMAAKMVVEIESLLEDETKQISVDHILTMLLRLAQVTSGHVKYDADIDPETGDKSGGNVEQIPGGNPKVDAVLDIAQDADRDPNGKMIVWCHFVEDIRVISAALAKAGIKHVGYHKYTADGYKVAGAREAEQRMNTVDDCRIFLGNAASAGEGLNILGYDRENPDSSTMYTDREIFVSCNWSMTQRVQAEDRAHRRGTRSSVLITDLMVPGTIDEEIRARVLAKKQKALMVQDVKDILAGLAGREV